MAVTKATTTKLRPATDWRTTDADELAKRRERAQVESFTIQNATPEHPVFSNFKVRSGSGLTYSVELRDIRGRQFACDCVDFRINGLGTCKHVEAVLLQLQARFKRLYRAAMESGSSRIEITLDQGADTVRLLAGSTRPPKSVRKWFGIDGRLAEGTPEAAVEAIRAAADSKSLALRISQEIEPWLQNRVRVEERKALRREYELKVQSGEWPAHETTVPLFPYQREGMLHLAFTERALLADEMGLGKTIQAIAACALLHRLGKARHALIVTPASLKTEWEEQIQRFTTLEYRIVFGSKHERLAAYDSKRGDRFFTIVNYEQMVPDSLDVNARLRPDIVVLDEAQRIKNWSTKTAQAIKRLKSRYAFVLTGTPIENRIDELHSLMDFLNPSVLGPLFRFNRDFYQFDDRGRPVGYQNLDLLHQRIRPYLLRRRKAEVETELPERTDRNHFVKMTELQRQNYAAHEQQVMRLVNVALRRPLTKQEQDKLLRELAMMRMTCDTNYILDEEDRECPKLTELEKLLEECEANDAKVIIFSEWERMLLLVRELCAERGIGYAWHTGSVPQLRRRGEINAFKSDPKCRVFLSTDSGATGLNLQNASVVINCDLPWNPAKLEQRIGRAWRKHQTRPVTVINLVCENSIEHRMLETLALKQSIADSVLDHPGAVKEIKLRGGRQAFVERLQQLVAHTGKPAPGVAGKTPADHQRRLSADPSLAFAQLARERMDGALVACEERYPEKGPHTVILAVVERDTAQMREQLAALHRDVFTKGKTDPLAPVQLQVIDRATHEAIERMIAAGLLSPTCRASRPLFGEAVAEEAPLSAEEIAQAAAQREAAGKKLRMAEVLRSSGFVEESIAPVLEAVKALGTAGAIDRRLPRAADALDLVRPPLSQIWGDALPLVASALEQNNADWAKLSERLRSLSSGT